MITIKHGRPSVLNFMIEGQSIATCVSEGAMIEEVIKCAIPMHMGNVSHSDVSVESIDLDLNNKQTEIVARVRGEIVTIMMEVIEYKPEDYLDI